MAGGFAPPRSVKRNEMKHTISSFNANKVDNNMHGVEWASN
jgi:hypothetical protein